MSSTRAGDTERSIAYSEQRRVRCAAYRSLMHTSGLTPARFEHHLLSDERTVGRIPSGTDEGDASTVQHYAGLIHHRLSVTKDRRKLEDRTRRDSPHAFGPASTRTTIPGFLR